MSGSASLSIPTRERWGRRHRAVQSCSETNAQSSLSPVTTVDLLGRTAEEKKGQFADEGGASSAPQNLTALLAFKLDGIITGHNEGSTVKGVVDLAGLMAQQGLFPRSKCVSAQSLLLEHSLSSSFDKVLQGGAQHLRGVFGPVDDLGLFDALRTELGRGEGAWSRGTKGAARIKWSIPGLNGCGLLDGEIVQDLYGDELPAFSFVLRSLAESVNAELLSWWVNIYEEGNVGLGFHHDHQGDNKGLRWGRIFDVTAGASFGAGRELTFRHAATRREFAFPQANGDIFAFDTQTDKEFLHGIYQQMQSCGPRISVIMVGKSHGKNR